MKNGLQVSRHMVMSMKKKQPKHSVRHILV